MRSTERPLFRVLSIDSGGVRGIIPVKVLAAFEAALGRPIFECFDLIVGTSFGGFAGLALAAPHPDKPGQAQITAAQLDELCHQHIPDIFRPLHFHTSRHAIGVKYNPAYFERCLKVHLGDTRLHQALTSVAVSAYELDTAQAVWMRHSKTQKPEAQQDFLMRHVIRAGCAVPSIIPSLRLTALNDVPALEGEAALPKDYHLVDGAVFAPNPALHALNFAEGIKAAGQKILLVSLGTGDWTGTVASGHLGKSGAYGWANWRHGIPILKVMMHALVSNVDDMLRHRPDIQYFRFDRRIDQDRDQRDWPSVHPDDASPQTIKIIDRFAERLVEEQGEKIEALAAILHKDFALREGKAAVPKPTIKPDIKFDAMKRLLPTRPRLTSIFHKGLAEIEELATRIRR